MIYNILINSLLSATSGYTTNKYALDSMLKEGNILDKLKINPCITKSKEKFIDNMSILMENDIINADKISDSFSSHNSDDEFMSFSSSFFNDCLGRDIKNLRLKDLPIFYDAYYSLKDVFINMLKSNIGSIMDSLSNYISLKEFISQEQINIIAQNIIDNFVLTLKNTNISKDIALDIYELYSEYKINDIVPKKVSEKIKLNLEKEASQLTGVIKNSMDGKIEIACEEILHIADIKGTTKKIKALIAKKPIKSIINLSTNDIKDKIIEGLNIFISSEKGEKAFTDLYYAIIEYLEAKKISLVDIFNSDYGDKISLHLKDKTNSVVYSVMQWLDANSIEINDMIKATVDETISGQDALRKKISLAISSYFNSKKYGDNSISKFLLEIADDGDNFNKISTYLIEEVKAYFKSISIKSMITTLEERKVISNESIKNIVEKIINDKNSRLIDKIIDNIISKPIGDYIKLEKNRLLDNSIKYILIDYIKENSFYSKSIYLELIKEINKVVFDTFSIKIKDIIDENIFVNYSDSINNEIIKDITKNNEFLKNKLVRHIEGFISKKSILDVINSLSESRQALENRICDRAVGYVNRNFTTIIDDIGDARLSKLLNKLSKIPSINEKSSEFMKAVIGESIKTIIDGYTKELVEQHFSDLNNNDYMCFIKETSLISINKISAEGAAIGAVIGGASELIAQYSFNSTLISNTFSWQGAVMCSLIGVATNLLAVSGLSKVCIKNELVKKIPLFKRCTNDFIKKKQELFAAYMANVVSNNLLNEEKIEDLVQSKGEKIKDSIFNTIIKDDYKKLYESIGKNRDFVTTSFTAGIKGFLYENRDIISKYISKNIAAMPLKYVFNRNFIDDLGSGISTNEAVINDISTYLKASIQSPNALYDFVPYEYKQELINEIVLLLNDKYSDNISFIKNTQVIKKHFIKHGAGYKKRMNMPIASLISEDSFDEVEAKIFEQIFLMLFDEEKISYISKDFFDILKDNFSQDKKLGDIINRRSRVFLSGMLYKYFIDIVTGLHTHMSFNRHGFIEEEINTKVLGNLNTKERNKFEEIGGQKAITSIINNIMLIKIPIFIENNKEKFYEISKTLLNDLYSNSLKNLDINIDYNSVEKITRELIVEKNNNSFIKNKCYLIFHTYFQRHKADEAYKIAKCFGIDSIDNIFTRYNTEIILAAKSLYSNLGKGKQAVLNEAVGLLDQIYYEALNSITIKKLFSALPQDGLEDMFDEIEIIGEKKDVLLLCIKNVINSFYNYLEDIDLMDSIISTNELRASVNDIFTGVKENKSFDLYCKAISQQIISEDLKKNISFFIPINVKKYMVELAADGLYAATKKNLVKLFKCMELDKITQKEILNLDTRVFQEKFNIFLDKNLKNILIQGLAASVLGINEYAGLGLTGIVAIKDIAKAIKEIKNKIHKKEDIL